MRFPAPALACGMALAFVASTTAGAQDRPITDDEPDVVDVAKTPVTDLNLDKDEIPALLVAAQREPYDLTGLSKCTALVAEVKQFDRLLGPDLDLPQEERDRVSAGRIGRTVVGSFIPFRGLIREISGANDHQRDTRAAIQAGLARRGFLKGVGAEKGCKYPARPATRTEVAAYMAEDMVEEQQKVETRQARRDAKREAREKRREAKRTKVGFTSKEVVQKTD